MLRTCKECELGVEGWHLLLIHHSGKKDTEADDEFSVQTRESRAESPQLRQGHRPGSGIGMDPSPRQQEKLTTRSPLQPPSQRTRCFVCAVVVSVGQRGAAEAPATNEAWPGAGTVRTTVHRRPKQLPTNLELRRPTPMISRGMALRVLKRMPRGESPLPAVPRAVTDCDRIKVDRQTATGPRKREGLSSRGAGANRQFPPPDGVVIQLLLGRRSRRRGGARQEHGQADCPAARPRSQGSTKWTLAAHHHAVSPIASPVAHAGTAALQQPRREQEEKNLPASTPACPSEPAENQPLSDLPGGLEPPRPTRRTPLFCRHIRPWERADRTGSRWSGRWAKPVRDI